MASKKTPKREAKTRVKNNAQNRKKSGGRCKKAEIISEEELEKRGGLTGDETALFTVYLQKFDKGDVHMKYSKKLKDLAKHIHEKEHLYVPKQGGYKLMEVSSIETELSVIRGTLREQREEKERQAKEKGSNKFLQK
ncbi:MULTISPECIES: DUF4119 family protein [Bacteroides]|jgi:hypothetical protein|uniref:DUF4119 family protein n=1 Tax=Bacteroides TaxID=816 RepID=UPI00033EFD9B|nr:MULTISPECIES: DUF4119 family protein [Bacteroides]CDA86036.1 uncharacterized protein BN772_03880 [Bacteroides sp. CAG:754]